MIKKLLAVIAVAAIIGLAACGGTEESEEESRGGAVPAPLNTIEAQAEDIIDIVPANKWDEVGVDIGKLGDAWDAYRAQALRDGAEQKLVERFDTALAGLRTSAEAKQSPDTMQRANDVSAATVELFGLYDVTIPVAVGRLDVIGRQIVLDADRRDLPGAGQEVDRAQTIWDGGLRADILGHDGNDVVKETDGELAALRRARDNGDFQALRTQASAFLEVVDSMEALY